MKIGIVAEGPDDREVIKQIVKCIKGIDTSDMINVLPKDAHDETDNAIDNFSNWELVLKEAEEHVLIDQFFEKWGDQDSAIVIHIDTAEKGHVNYNIPEPQRQGNTDFTAYSVDLRSRVKAKIEALLPASYHPRVAYAIAIEETEAWIIPLFENRNGDTSSRTDPKAHLERLISKDKKTKAKYFDTNKKRLNALKLGKLLSKTKQLNSCRQKNKSLDIFCLEVASIK